MYTNIVLYVHWDRFGKGHQTALRSLLHCTVGLLHSLCTGLWPLVVPLPLPHQSWAKHQNPTKNQIEKPLNFNIMGSKIRKYLNFRAKNQIENFWISVLWVQKSTWIYWQKMIIYPSVNFRIRNFKSAMPGWCSIYKFFSYKISCIFLVLFFRWICMNLKLEYLWMILSF